jgi:hypothetical protein
MERKRLNNVSIMMLLIPLSLYSQEPEIVSRVQPEAVEAGKPIGIVGGNTRFPPTKLILFLQLNQE